MTPYVIKKIMSGASDTLGCSKIQQAMLQDLTMVQKYICRIISKSVDDCNSNTFHAQANLLTDGILKHVDLFSTTVKAFYDRSGQA